MSKVTLYVVITGTTEHYCGFGNTNDNGKVEFNEGSGSARLETLFKGEKTLGEHMNYITKFLDKNLADSLRGYKINSEVER